MAADATFREPTNYHDGQVKTVGLITGDLGLPFYSLLMLLFNSIVYGCISLDTSPD